MQRRTALSLAGSFAVYLLPVVGPHAGMPVGALVAFDLGRLFQGKDPAWVAVDLLLVAALQLGTFALLRFVLAEGGWRWLALPPAGIGALWAVNFAFLAFIPSLFLIESENSDEQLDWPVACVLPDAHLMQVAGAADGALARAGEAWVEREPDGHWGLLTGEGCALTPLGPSTAMGFSVDYAVPGARALLRRQAGASGQTHWLISGAGNAPLPLARPEALKGWAPVLSADGAEIAWVERAPRDTGRRAPWDLLRRDVDGGAPLRVALPPSVRSSLRIIAMAGRGGPVVIAHLDGVVVVDAGGRVLDTPMAEAGADTPRHAVALPPGGWVAWDQYREEGRYRIAWSLPAGSARHEVPMGRGINQVAVDPSGRYIAVSVSTSLSIGSVRDAVYVLRAGDGAEVFRRFLPRYSRAPVAFLGDGLFAYTRYDTVGGRVRGRVEVLQVPGPDA